MFNHLVPPNQCGEGQVMALRAGAELAIMEQYPWLGRRVVVGAQRLKNWTRSSPATPSGYPAGRIVNVAGEVMPEMTGITCIQTTFSPMIVEFKRRSKLLKKCSAIHLKRKKKLQPKQKGLISW
jgi:hypothetical protein